MDDSQKADLLAFVKQDGKGFIGVHSAPDTFYKWPEYGEMVGGYFDGHPWNTFKAPVLIEDPNSPMTKHFTGKEFTILDEIYQAKNYSRNDVRVLMRLNEDKLDLTGEKIVPKLKRTDKRLGRDVDQELRQGPRLLFDARPTRSKPGKTKTSRRCIWKASSGPSV